MSDTESIVTAPPLRSAAVGFPESVNRQERTLSVTISTSMRDRQGDIVEPSGLDFANFMKNPVVLWAHDLERPPVGKVVSVTPGAGSVTAEIRFAETDFAEEVFTLYAGGFLHAWSLGFIPKRWERLKTGDGQPDGFHILEAEVVEVSAVPVPANPEALTHALKSLKSEDLKSELAENSESEETAKPSSRKSLTIEQFGTLASTLIETLATAAATRNIASLRGAL